MLDPTNKLSTKGDTPLKPHSKAIQQADRQQRKPDHAKPRGFFTLSSKFSLDNLLRALPEGGGERAPRSDGLEETRHDKEEVWEGFVLRV